MMWGLSKKGADWEPLGGTRPEDRAGMAYYTFQMGERAQQDSEELGCKDSMQEFCGLGENIIQSVRLRR